jgi:hypothetical protein
MEELSLNVLNRLREDDPDVAHILDVFGEIERIYHEALEAMGAVNKSVHAVGNSAEVTVSFRSTAIMSTSSYGD